MTDLVYVVVYADGVTHIPQTRSTVAVSLVYADGELGSIPLSQPRQLAVPTSDVADGTWTPSTGVDLYACVDETPVLDDADYIRSDATPVDDTAILALTALSTPVAGTVTLRIRGRWTP